MADEQQEQPEGTPDSVHGKHRMQQPDEPRRGQRKNARPGEQEEQVEPGLPRAVRPEDRDEDTYAKERRSRGPQESREEYHKRERERDAGKPLHERRPEFLTDEERVQRVEEIDRRTPGGYSPTAGLGES
jgi:hypothetical protein